MRDRQRFVRSATRRNDLRRLRQLQRMHRQLRQQTISNDVWNYYNSLSTAENVNPRKMSRDLDLSQDILRYKEDPEIIQLPIRNRKPITFLRIITVVGWDPEHRRYYKAGRTIPVLLSNGIVSHTSNRDVAPDEYVLAYTSMDQSTGEKTLLPDFTYLYGPAFIRTWLNLVTPPYRRVAYALLEVAARNDTPQEAFVTWCVKTVQQRLQILLSTNKDKFLHTVFHRLHSLTLAELIRWKLRFVQNDLHKVELSSGGYGSGTRRTAHEDVDEYDDEEDCCDEDCCDEDDDTINFDDFGASGGNLVSRIVRAVYMWLNTQNLIAPNLLVDDLLEIPIRDIVTWANGQQQHISRKAEGFRDIIAEKLGFHHVILREFNSHRPRQRRHIWIKSLHPGTQRLVDQVNKNRLSWARCQKSLDDAGSVSVDDLMTIKINGGHRCVVSSKSVLLPKDDQIARRLVAVSLLRHHISTLKGDEALLKQLFPPEVMKKNFRIWDELQTRNRKLQHEKDKRKSHG